VKWIASSIVTLEMPKSQPAPMADDDDNEDVHAWAQAHGVNMIPNDNDDDANVMAPIVDNDEDDAVVVPQEEDDDNNDQAVAQLMPATQNKTLWAMRQLATFYNPAATNYIQAMDSNEDTVATSNQLRREGADAADPDPDDDDSDVS